jgi:hypothetical protein
MRRRRGSGTDLSVIVSVPRGFQAGRPRLVESSPCPSAIVGLLRPARIAAAMKQNDTQRNRADRTAAPVPGTIKASSTPFQRKAT